MISLSEINAINDDFIKLLNYTEKLQCDERGVEAFETVKNIKPIIRKLCIASVLQSKKVICISGLQGAGKTTLMKNFYGIGDEYVNISLERGESLPILITEGNVTEPQMVANCIEKNVNGIFEQFDRIVSKDEIVAATKDDNSLTMYLELTVPYKHTFNSGVSFLLLPGFERRNDFLNDLIKFSINSSDAAVFVFDETSISHIDNELYLNIVEKQFGSNVIFAVTRSDSSHDENVQVKQTIIKRLNITDPERVVCVGQYTDAQKNEEWIASFKSAIDKYALFGTSAFQRTDEFIINELLCIKSELYSTLRILNEMDKDDLENFKNHSYLKCFDETILKKRKELAKNISSKFEEAIKNSSKIFEDKLIVDSDLNPLDPIRRTLFGTSVKDIKRTREAISNSIEVVFPDKYLAEALLSTVNSISKSSVLSQLVDKKDIDNKKILLETEKTIAVQKDICNLLQIRDSGKDLPTLNEKKNIKKLINAVAEVVTYYYGITTHNEYAMKSYGIAYYEPSISTLTGDDIIGSAKSSKQFAVGLAGVMGIDVLADGSLNFISQIAESFGVSLGYAGAGAVVIVGAGIVCSVMRDINRMQRADYESGKMAICAVYDNIQRLALDGFDDYVSKVREQIEYNLEDLSGCNKNRADIYNAKVVVNKLIDSLEILVESYQEKTNDISSYFK